MSKDDWLLFGGLHPPYLIFYPRDVANPSSSRMRGPRKHLLKKLDSRVRGNDEDYCSMKVSYSSLSSLRSSSAIPAITAISIDSVNP
jgi:hypothetical protein